ncbi:Lpg1974 family pore-forming outer membrane protein [Legionella shakespearei]|uniref:Major outer membrane protein n=1 Tax=Legionella shakespearei DSM 23087 TaxID=1122169 RepID=A0A0W0Z4W0_9GAMM|nr:Lpg1974 family pore-forming outer membrane protein [Legionella shakespearei]KTD64186.1 hypothetical protein Lsha_0617 [Legionella shakespearei DSM 23087]
MIYGRIPKACFFGFALANAGVSFAGTMGDVQDDSKRYFFSASAVYAAISDESLNKFHFVDTISPTGNIVSHLSDVDPRWGYALSLGYQFGPQYSNDVVLSYTNLKNHGTQFAGNSEADALMKNTMSLAMGNADDNPTLTGPALASMSSYYEFQSGELMTHHNFQSKFADQIRFSRFYGIKATEFKKGFETTYNGTVVSLGFDTEAPQSDYIQYEAKYWGIGPKAGAGAYWDFNRYFSIGGDLSLAVLGGNRKSQLNESLRTGTPIFNMPVSNLYTYHQAYDSALWVVPVLGANLVASFNYDFTSGNRLGLEAGLNTEQYWSETASERYRRKDGANSITINQRFSLRNVFLKASYYC